MALPAGPPSPSLCTVKITARGGNLEPDGANLYTKPRNRPLPRPVGVASSATSAVIITFLETGGRHVLRFSVRSANFPSDAAGDGGEVIDAMEIDAAAEERNGRTE